MLVEEESLTQLNHLNQFNLYWNLLGHEGLGFTELRFKSKDKTKQVFVNNKEQFTEHLLQCDLISTKDVFVGVNPRISQSGKSKDVSYLTNIVLDLDNLSPDFFLPQSLVKYGYQVNSGRGAHIYIPIDPYAITESNRKLVTLMLKDIKDLYKKMLLGKSKVDNVHDLARVMRCPGTINTKNNKLAELLIDKAIVRYDFELIYKSIMQSDKVIALNKTELKDYDITDLIDDKLKFVINKSYPSMSEKVFAIVKYLISFGYPKEVMVKIVDSIKDKDKDYSQDIDRIINKVIEDSEIKPINLYWDKYQDNLDKREIGFLTGIDFIDEKTGGFMRKELVVIGARSSIGKTTFCMNLILEFLERDIKVLMFPTEMSFTPLLDKLISMKCKIPLWKFRKNQLQEEELKTINNIKDEVKRYKFWVSENSSPKLHEVEHIVSNLHPDILVLDYVQRVSTQMPDKRNMELEMFVRGMKNIAIKNNCCVILTSQLNRMGDEEQPEIKTLRDTDTLEHEGDLVILLGTNNKLDQNRILNVQISKNRYGELGYAPLTFDTQVGIIK